MASSKSNAFPLEDLNDRVLFVSFVSYFDSYFTKRCGIPICLKKSIV